MRRTAAILALVLLTLSLVLGSAAVSAKPGSGNSPNAKDCQKGKWDDLATREDRGTAFTSEAACVSYAAMGGTLVAHVEGPWIEVSFAPWAHQCFGYLTGFNTPDTDFSIRFTYSDSGFSQTTVSGSGDFGAIGFVAGETVITVSATVVGGAAIPVFTTPALPYTCPA